MLQQRQSSKYEYLDTMPSFSIVRLCDGKDKNKMSEFVHFTPIKADQERARRFWEIRKENEKKGIVSIEAVTLESE